MIIKVLGCSGGIGQGLRTTSLLVNEHILIDAGTGVGDLTIDQLLKIDHIFVTHSHLDHITCIPFLLDTVMGLKDQAITVYATAETIHALKTHIFNWKIWPDFNVIPSAEVPFLGYQTISIGQTTIIGNIEITALPAQHVVPAVGYQVNNGEASLVFTGDTTSCDALWVAVNQIKNLKYLLIETAFSNAEQDLAKISKHLCPNLLADELDKLTVAAQVFITHLKPADSHLIMDEIKATLINRDCLELLNNQEFAL